MEENKNEGKWGLPCIGIPAEALFHPDLSSTEKLLFGFIRNLSQSRKGCWASNRWLGERLKVDPRTISRYLTNLEELGFIERKYLQKKGATKEEDRSIFVNYSYQKRYKYLVETVHEDGFFAK